jgi:hypothetical protein
VHVAGQLLVQGFYDPHAIGTPTLGALGPLTNLTAPATSFVVLANFVSPATDDLIASGARGEVDLLGGGTCDSETGCCLTTRLAIFYRDVPRDSYAAWLTIRRECFSDTTGSCSTILRGNIFGDVPLAVERG